MAARERPLALYLQGHYAASEAAVRSVRQQAAQRSGDDLGALLTRLGREIAEDQATLEDVMARVDVTPSAVRAGGAVVTATLGRWILRVQMPGEPQARLAGLESLSLGIEGKASLWRALREIAANDPRLTGLDFDALAKRAESQREQLEPHRLDAARRAAG
jgi:hypothetical protein